jgi:hypothetical protein
MKECDFRRKSEKTHQIWSYCEGEIPVRKLKFGLKKI